MPHITDDWSATFGDPAALTPDQRQYLATSDALIDEILGADLIVIGAPMYNFTIGWPLKAWIDQVVRLHRTVTFGSAGPSAALHLALGVGAMASVHRVKEESR